MKLDIITANSCPFSNQSCFKIDKSLYHTDKVAQIEMVGNAFVCPFFVVTDNNLETFDGFCKVSKAIDYLIETNGEEK